jgi:iron complex outermembrane receptor protein
MKKSVTGLSGRESKQTNRRIALAKIQLCVGLVSFVASAWVQAVETVIPNAAGAIKANLHTFNIGKQPLYSALNAIAEQGGVQFVYTDEMVKGLSSPGVSGQLSTEDALNKVLEGSGLGYRFNNGNTITLEAKPVQIPSLNQTEPTSLPKVNVVGNAVYDVKDPYNQDYVLPDASVGTKTDTPIIETPLSVQVISKQVLKDQQVIRLEDALNNVSGVTTSANPSNLFGGTTQSIFLRGFSSSTYMRNGFRLQQGSASREMANVEAVEVLKGPAAILYGQVEPGGIVNIVTKQPLETPYYAASQQFGSYDTYRSTIDTSGPLSKNKDVLYRVNLSYENSGSFRDFVGREDVFFAPVLRWNISPKTQVTFEMEYNHLHQGLDSQFVPVLPGFNMPISRNYAGYNPGTTETIFGGINWSHQFNDDWTLKHRFSVNQQSIIAQYTQTNFSGTKTFLQNLIGGAGVDSSLDALPDGSYVARTFNTSAGDQYNTMSNNMDLVGHFDTAGLKHTLLLGGDYYGLDTTFNEGSPLPVFPGAGYFSYVPLNNPAGAATPFGPSVPFGPTKNKTDQYGVYIQDQIKLPYDVHVTGGIRYQNIHQTSLIEQSQAYGGVTSLSASTQDAVTPRVGLLWHPKNWLSLYANYAESFGPNSGLTFVSPGFGKIVNPTSAAQYEGGFKFAFFEDKLRATLAYYDLTKDNIAVPDPNQTHNCGAGPGTCVIALGEVRSRGPELDIQGEILPGWKVITTWANVDIIVTKSNPNGDPVSSGTNGAAYSVGSRLTNVPRNTGRIWNTYEVQGTDYKGISFGGGVTLRDGQLVPDQTLPANAPMAKIPGYATLDLMAGYSRKVGDAKISIQFNVNNLLDKQYLTAAYNQSAGNGTWVNFGTPRTFMGQISVQY